MYFKRIVAVPRTGWNHAKRTGHRLPNLVLRDVRRDLGERDERAGPRGVLDEVEADLPLQKTHFGCYRDPVLGVDGEEERADVYVVSVRC